MRINQVKLNITIRKTTQSVPLNNIHSIIVLWELNDLLHTEYLEK